MKIFFSFNKIQKFLLLFSAIIKISFSSSFQSIPKGNGILNMKYNHSSDNNLYFIFQHFRHGARTTCEGKIINNTDILGGKWKNIGGLTKIGKSQQYSIGLNNRLRYKNFINNEYDPKEIKIYSTDYIRTINSAQIQLLGFYNKVKNFNTSNKDIIGEEKININLNNIIPPVNLFEFKKEGNKEIYQLLYSEKFVCPLFKKNIDKNKQKLYYFEKLNNIRNNFNKKYGIILSKEFQINNTNSHTGMYNFCDAFIANFYDEKNNKLKLIEIERKNKQFNLNDILNICYDYYKEYFFTIEGEKYAKINSILSMSKTMQEITDIMKDRIDNGKQDYINYNSPKFLLYSGHDDTLTQMQMILKICFNIEYEWIPYSSTQLFELRKYGNNFYVEIFYNDRLKLNITFKQFNDEINKIIMNEKEIYKKCYRFKNKSYFYGFLWLIIIFILLFIFYTSILLYFYCEKLERNKKSRPIKII